MHFSLLHSSVLSGGVTAALAARVDETKIITALDARLHRRRSHYLGVGRWTG